jgi:hypothetical protein
MQTIQDVSITKQGPSKLLYAVYDNENYEKHREMLQDTDRTMDTLKIDHLVTISNAKTVKLEEDRANLVERANRNLFSKIEGIINRQGPYKLQPSKKNTSKLAKIFHAPSDNLVTASTYFPRQTYSMTQVKRDQRDTANRKLQEENMKVLDRIMAAKPTVRLEALQKHEKMYKKLKKNHNNGFE